MLVILLTAAIRRWASHSTDFRFLLYTVRVAGSMAFDSVHYPNVTSGTDDCSSSAGVPGAQNLPSLWSRPFDQ